MTLFKKQYRIESTRLPGWNYAAGWYFVTLCARGQEPFFGEIIAGEVCRSAIGEAVCEHWENIPVHFPNARLDEFVVMPNHIHGIVIIEEQDPGRRDAACCVFEREGAGPKTDLKAGSLGAIIRSFKSAVTRWCNSNGYSSFAWQPRFYDHIIRNEESLNQIRAYIRNNPAKWELDEYNPHRQRIGHRR